VQCGTVTCDTVGSVSGGKLPVGDYLVGTFYLHGDAKTPWFNLYPKRSNGGFWDYHSKVPEYNCRGGFGLHEGKISEGCITVSDEVCFQKIRQKIDTSRKITMSTWECKKCIPYLKKCLFGEVQDVIEGVTTTLQVQ